VIRSYEETDRHAVLALNAANVPEVGPMDGSKLDGLAAAAVSFDIIEVEAEVVGFMILLGPGASYRSPNYAWFSDNYDSFIYVDRIALGEGARGRGFGPELYDRAVEAARTTNAPVVLAEVNTIPSNPRSMRFHELFGFVEVSRLRPYSPDEETAMLVYRVDHEPATD